MSFEGDIVSFFKEGKRFYRETPEEKGTGKGSFADQAQSQHTINPDKGGGRAGGAGGAGTSGASPSAGGPAGGKPGGDNKPKAGGGGAAKQASGAAGKLKNSSVGKALNVKGELDDLKRIAKEDGKGAAAAAAGVKGAKAVAGKTGVGTAVVAGINEAQNRINKIGKALGAKKDIASDKNIGYAILFALLLTMLPSIIFFLVIFYAWEFPERIILMSFTNIKTFVGAVQALAIDEGMAGKMAYEVDANSSNAALAAPVAGAPEQGTYAWKMAQIDWEKAKYQTLPSDERCVITTKEVVSTIDGKKRSVIDKVTVKSMPDKDLQGVARQNCINNTYPIFNTIMRSQFVREGVNAKLNVRYAYAEPQDSETLKQSSNTFKTTLRDKTLTRIWGRGTQYNKPTPIDKAAWEAYQKLVVGSPEGDYKDGYFKDGSRRLEMYTDTKYSQEVRDCANYFIPPNYTRETSTSEQPILFPPVTSEDLNNFYQKNIDKQQNDLKCGIEPKDLKLYTTFLPESNATNPPPDKPQFALMTKRAALNVVCDMKNRLLDEEVVKNYKDTVKDRINAAAVSGFQAMTYADTHHDRWLNIKELSGDFYKIAGMQKGQEYNYTLDRKAVGTQLEPDAISRLIGYYNAYSTLKDPSTITVPEQDYIDGLQEVLTYVGDRETRNSPCDAAASRPGESLSAQDIATINTFWDRVYPKFKKAMAGLQFYANPQKSSSISQIYKDLSYDDIFFRIIRAEANSSTAGTEDGPQNFNRMNFGAKAYNNAASLAMGGRFLSADEAVARDNNNQIAIDYDSQSRGIAWRLFNLQNPGSLTSRIAVAFLDYPQNIPSNLASTTGSLLSPLRNAAGQRGTIASLITGKNREALAASSYDIVNLKLDPAGITSEMTKDISPEQNAAFIEALKKQSKYAELFAKYDECYKEFIPSRLHLKNPSEDKLELYTKYCVKLFDYVPPSGRSSQEYQLARRYSAYHFAMLGADALMYLSDPDKVDSTLNATVPTTTSTTATSPTGGTTPVGGGVDTSNQACPAGTTLVNSKEPVYGVGKVLKYYITLCKVGGTTVNVSVAQNLLNMQAKARTAGINLTGDGFRSYDAQVDLRIAHGCPDPTAPSSTCTPPTAIPGTSNHGDGVAVDFDNSGTQSTAVFQWLKGNAAGFGFFNFPKEAWHWSINGK